MPHDIRNKLTSSRPNRPVEGVRVIPNHLLLSQSCMLIVALIWFVVCTPFPEACKLTATISDMSLLMLKVDVIIPSTLTPRKAHLQLRILWVASFLSLAFVVSMSRNSWKILPCIFLLSNQEYISACMLKDSVRCCSLIDSASTNMRA